MIPFLLKTVGQGTGVVLDPEGLFLGFFRVRQFDEWWFSEKESKVVNPAQLVFEGGIMVK